MAASSANAVCSAGSARAPGAVGSAGSSQAEAAARAAESASAATSAVRVRVPATSANLGPGFDAFGLALQLYDEVVVRTAETGCTVSVRGAGAGVVSTGEDNLVVTAMRAAFDELGVAMPGLRVECDNRIPHGRGLGSSAGAIVAGVLAARALVPQGRRWLDEADVLDLAGRLEGHVDNVAACLLGGLTVGWRGGLEPADATATATTSSDTATERAWQAVRIEPDPRLRVSAFVPEAPVSTTAARGLLPATVAHSDAVSNAGRAGLLVAALAGTAAERSTRSGLALLREATADWLHQSYREPVLPQSLTLLRELRRRGAAAIVSGAGPTVLAFGRETEARSDGETSARVEPAWLAEEQPPGFSHQVLGIDRVGATVGPS